MHLAQPGILLDKSFYLSDDVVHQARMLLGCRLFSKVDGILTSGIIVETEAYAGINDRASHAFGGRFTPRTKTMYEEGGCAYVYLCYGMYELFNVVTGPQGVPNAVLIRAVHPLEGLDVMMHRRGKNQKNGLADGPGKLSIALGISRMHNAQPLDGTLIGISKHFHPEPDEIIVTPRIGVDYAGDDARLPYRFVWNSQRLK
ncbi:MAG: DNA-3-methyladenine glycosylase [Bacteroidetes bacterium]|nr:DNA-3-methyladenine glycosylase [Bacteroidota bacterium]